MAMNRVAESYSTQNKRNEKLRWRARRDETYNKTQCVEFHFEIACVLNLTLNAMGYFLNSSNRTVSSAFYERFLNCSIQHTVFPHIRPAGIIISHSLQMRVLLENNAFSLQKIVRNAGVIRVAGIIRWRVLYEEIRYSLWFWS